MTRPKIKNVLYLVLFLAVAAIVYLAWNRPEPANAPAPASEPGWLSFTDQPSGVSFQYPKDFGTNLNPAYISTVDWPPKVQALDQSFSCLSAGNANNPAGRTELKNIGGRQFCVTEESEGAAGSIYAQYAYGFEKGSREIILTFSLRYVQCGNYPEPRMTECQTERNSFSPDGTLGKIADTLH